MTTTVEQLERRLNDFSAAARREALETLVRDAKRATAGGAVNSHCHTFFSYNGYGMSPSAVAWWAAKTGLYAAALIDFDVLDGVEEFLGACAALGLRGGAGMETRAFIPELADKEINSPGEPGIAYHEGIGFYSGTVPAAQAVFAKRLRDGAAARGRGIVDRVNAFLAPLAIDYVRDVMPLTPSGNVTERHICAAYDLQARALFKDAAELTAFWAGKLGMAPEKAAATLKDPVEFRNLLRSKTMKSSGPGYVKPEPAAFPSLKEMNAFILACDALPTLAWLNGESAGEKDVDGLLDLHERYGMAIVNIIPDRNHNFADPAVKAKKVHELNRFIAAAEKRDLPIVVGTEMNAPGQRMLDDFESDALKPHLPEFRKGAAIQHAHTLLTQGKMGYLSDWARKHFASRADKNRFFAAAGETLAWDKLPWIREKGPALKPTDLVG